VNTNHSDDGSGIPDAVLDRALREMLDVEPPPNLRDRVLMRIDASPSPLRWMWIAVPAAVAIVLAVLLLPRAHDARKPSEMARQPIAPAAIGQPTNRATTEVATVSTPAVEQARQIRAAVANEPPPSADEAAVAALDAPAPLGMPNIDEGRATPMTAIQLIPIGVRPIDVDALNDSPQERH
jgi:hypothetical protein